MINNVFFKYSFESKQRKVIYDFLKKIEDISCINIINKEILKGLPIQDFLNNVIDIFDEYVSDEMRIHEGKLPEWTDCAAGYYRSDSQKMLLPIEIQDKLPILNENGVIGYIGFHKHINYYNQIFGGTTYQLTPKLSILILSGKNPEPICGLPRQEIYKEFLLCGINPLKSYLKRDQITKRKDILLKVESHSNVQQIFEQKIQRIESIYRSIYEKFYKVYPFSSGTSANEFVIHALEKYGKDIKGIFVHEYWYYENLPTIRRLFKNRNTNNLEESNVFFLNLEPTNYLNLDYNKTVIEPLDIIAKIVILAGHNKDIKYYLIIDNTVSPFFNNQVLEEYLSLPNTILITTTSLSKHQNGERKYFFGILSLYKEDSKFKKYINDIKELVNGNLSFEQKKNFPLIEYQDVTNKMQTIEKLNMVFHKRFSNNLKWFSIPLTFNTVVYPIKELKKKNKRDIEQFNLKLRDYVSKITINYNKEGIEFGDSFGLKTTRVTVQGDKDNFHLPRISPGFETNEEELIEFAGYFSDKISKFQGNN